MKSSTLIFYSVLFSCITSSDRAFLEVLVASSQVLFAWCAHVERSTRDSEIHGYVDVNSGEQRTRTNMCFPPKGRLDKRVTKHCCYRLNIWTSILRCDDSTSRLTLSLQEPVQLLMAVKPSCYSSLRFRLNIPFVSDHFRITDNARLWWISTRLMQWNASLIRAHDHWNPFHKNQKKQHLSDISPVRYKICLFFLLFLLHALKTLKQWGTDFNWNIECLHHPLVLSTLSSCLIL